jgi:hypothetical protein
MKIQVCAEDINLLGKHINNMKEKHKTPSDTSNDVHLQGVCSCPIIRMQGKVIIQRLLVANLKIWEWH